MRSSPWRAAAAALAVLVASACGSSNDEEKKLFGTRRSVCDALVANARTQREAVSDLSAPGAGTVFGGTECASNKFIKLPNRPDTCQYGTTPSSPAVCRTLVEWQAFSSDLCSANGCIYFCEVRFMEGSAPPGSDGLSDASVCGTDWESGQPFL